MRKQKKIKTLSADTVAFREWLDSIPFGKYSDTLDLICEELKINRVRIQNLRSGMSLLSPLEKAIINRIAGTEVFTL